ncbi:hypothetical protein AbraIFM66951_000985 [Aspergillus brasiliensis]|uniref:Xylanolytic transcriptional activator regulatory domain-containing protein n=1 Tax=Aspergillus brasiliensis TaxID=319629 RepID=A0A9W6DKB9_9EURO|nr:hypothetical protein AbraCBS73388_000996 [Aspergillus brasiliensis]GKZ42276.1 hypothetical protein AbraIFM66951_000985 [Aspergillus brasiliensis]
MQEHNGGRLTSRVCDRCIRKKVKCMLWEFLRNGSPLTQSDQVTRHGQPALDAGSSEKRAGHNQTRPRPNESPRLRNEDIPSREQNSSPKEHVFPGTSSLTPLVGSSQGLDDSSPQLSTPGLASKPRFTPQQVELLLNTYFDNFQDANPIFSKDLFFDCYRSSLCAEDLIASIVIITAKLTGFPANEEDLQDLNLELDHLLSSSLLEDDLAGDTPSLDQFRKTYLLAFYEFHQFPGHHAWLRIGRLTRMAYRIGLDRLDHVRALYSDWRNVSIENIQEWRWIWWCIYRLDCYSNLSSGMPYLIDDATIGTSLVRSRPILHPDLMEELPHEFSLPPSPDHLPRMLLAASLYPETMLMNIHTITSAILRQAGHVLRMHMVRSAQTILVEVAKAEKQLATIRSALPSGWLNPRRNALSNESHIDYHARMVTIFHLRMAQLLLSIVDCGQRQFADECLTGWERILEPCQDIASVADHWDSSFCLAVDPAVCFTFFTALVFLDLHRKTAAPGDTSTAEHDSSHGILDHHITVLSLQLQHFAKIWTLPRLLKLSFESFHQSVSGPLSHRHIALILSHFESPLHPRWLQFLSTAHTVLAGSEMNI